MINHCFYPNKNIFHKSSQGSEFFYNMVNLGKTPYSHSVVSALNLESHG